MKSFGIVFFLFAAIGAAQAPPAPSPAPRLAPDTVIAEYGDGQKLTYGELQRFMSILTPQVRQNVMRNRKELVEKYLLISAYRQIPVGNPLEPGTLQGPLISLAAVENMALALRRAGREGGRILCGGKPLRGRKFPGGRYVSPCLVKIRPGAKIVREETFAPILYLTAYAKAGGRHRLEQRRAAGLEFRHFHQRPARGRIIPVPARERLRPCQRQPWDQRRGNRRRLWGREGNRGRPGKRQRRLEKLHAPPNRDHQLFLRAAFGPGHPFRWIGVFHSSLVFCAPNLP